MKTLMAMLLLTVPAAAQHVRIGAGAIPNSAMTPPSVLLSTLPVYTSEALTKGIEGVVTLEARMSENGELQTVRMLKALGFGLEERALASVKDWRFSPALRNGVPVAVVAQIDVPFNLRGANAFQLGPGITPPTITKRVEPRYPPEARALRLEGTVVLQALIKKDGTIDILRVVQGLPSGLTESAIDALKQWQFNPGVRRVDPVDVALTIEVNFNLRSQ